MSEIYEITKIERFNGNISHDFKRMGRLCTIEVLEEGSSAVLAYVLENNTSIVTASVDHVTKGEDVIEFTTTHSRYTLRNVSHIIKAVSARIANKKDCITCGGDGCYPGDMEEACPSCGGTGEEDGEQ